MGSAAEPSAVGFSIVNALSLDSVGGSSNFGSSEGGASAVRSAVETFVKGSSEDGALLVGSRVGSSADGTLTDDFAVKSPTDVLSAADSAVDSTAGSAVGSIAVGSFTTSSVVDSVVGSTVGSLKNTSPGASAGLMTGPSTAVDPNGLETDSSAGFSTAASFAKDSFTAAAAFFVIGPATSSFANGSFAVSVVSLAASIGCPAGFASSFDPTKLF